MELNRTPKPICIMMEHPQHLCNNLSLLGLAAKQASRAHIQPLVKGNHNEHVNYIASNKACALNDRFY